MSRVACNRWLALVVAIWVACLGGAATACPICGQPTVTLSERLARSDTALLVQWVSARPGSDEQPEETTFEIVEVQRAAGEMFKKGQRLTLPRLHEGRPGNLVLLMGRQAEDGSIKWEEEGPLDVTETSYQYIVQTPSPETPTARRLEYFLRFLEYPDVLIGNDAFAEFVNAPSADIFAVASRLPREKLKRWLVDEKLNPGRQAGFGLMLGLCGRMDDAPLLEQRIFDRSGERRVGIEGVIVGYLLLTGDTGLDQVDRKTLGPADTEDGELYAVEMALRYLWSYGDGRVSKDRLKASMHLILDRPHLTEIVVKDLARWKDWTLLPRLMAMYDDPAFADKLIHKAIVRFMIAATKDIPAADADEKPSHARQAAEYLAQLKRADPKLVGEVERFFYVD